MLTRHLIRQLKRAEKGQSLVEYAMILSIVSIASIVILGLVGMAASRNLGVAVGALGGQKNAGGSPGAGTINTIWIHTSPTADIATCHIVSLATNPTTCAALNASALGPGFCPVPNTTQVTYVTVVYETSPDMVLADMSYSLDPVYTAATTANTQQTVGTDPFSVTLKSSNSAICPQAIVIQGKKATAIMPMQRFVTNDP